MKFEIIENKHGVSIEFKPETLQDMTLLARIGLNVKKKPARIYISASETNPYGHIYFEKIKEPQQTTYIKR